MTYIPTDRPAKPRKGSVKLKPEFVRRKHLGPVTRPQAVAEIENLADMTWRRDTSPIPEINAAIRRAAVRQVTL